MPCRPRIVAPVPEKPDADDFPVEPDSAPVILWSTVVPRPREPLAVPGPLPAQREPVAPDDRVPPAGGIPPVPGVSPFFRVLTGEGSPAGGGRRRSSSPVRCARRRGGGGAAGCGARRG
ncbi:hypothetical protein FRACA_3140006 [Frankia canadensis]|uniref:Uncharacterized protein n=1 Tax=Frankia canadensis TaxID=1836972 RepID=A0A2I2KUD5_9ACTN|nr:hypothetical protein FRACA_3140006 [Frankia canadensis]SOU56566.1 hypothetical protein FRACA_3140006 [Frankia canadensis]